MNADIGHMFLQDQDPLALIDKCGPYIVHAHLENMKGVHNHLVPYEGDMDLTAYLQSLFLWDLTDRHRLMCINMIMRRLRKRAWSI